MSIRITKSDCDARRKVKLRGGKVCTLHAYSAKPFSYPVLGYDENGTAMEWTDTGVIDLGTSKALDDIVSFVEDQAPKLQITEKDIGRKVNLRNGDVATLTGFDQCNPCSVQGIHRGQEACWTTIGWFGVPNDNMFDIVSFVEEPAFTITEEDCKAKRKVKLRDGRVTTLTGYKEGGCQPIKGVLPGHANEVSWSSNGNFQKGDWKTEDDIVSFVEETAFIITEEDIKAHRNVKLRDGRLATLSRVERGYGERELPFPVVAQLHEHGHDLHWDFQGRFDHSGCAPQDIVEFVGAKAPTFVITEADCKAHRKVKLRNGETVTLTAYQGGATQPILGQSKVRGTGTWYNTGEFGYTRARSEVDIVGFVEETPKPFTITEADCKAKRKVKLRNGDTVTLSDFNTLAWAYPVEGCGDVPGGRECWTVHGGLWAGKQDHQFDIVAFVEPVLVDLTMEEIGALVGTHNYKHRTDPKIIRLIRSNAPQFWNHRNQAELLIAPVGTEDWKPMQKESTNA